MQANKNIRIAIIGQYGGGNLGDGAIWESILCAIKKRIPDSEIVGYTCDANDTRVRHGITAYQLRWTGDNASTEGDESGELVGDRPQESEPTVGEDRLFWMRKKWWALDAWLRNYQITRSNCSRLQEFDQVLVAGSGQFSSLFGGAWTHPFTLWQWAVAAKRTGTPFNMLSVGAGELKAPSRTFTRWAISAAAYTSFRDSVSRSRVFGRKSTEIPVVPDLAYAYPLEHVPDLVTSTSESAVIGISPMAYADPRFYPHPDILQYRRHIESLSELSIEVLAQGHAITLFTTDEPDKLTQQELFEEIAKNVSDEMLSRVHLTNAKTVSELIDILSSVDIVVAARLHGALLAHVVGRPTLAIAHDLKVNTLMRDMRQSEYSVDIARFEAPEGWSLLREIIRHREALAVDISKKVSLYRTQVELQYDQVLSPIAEVN